MLNNKKILYPDLLRLSRSLETELVQLDFESLPIHESVKSYYRFDLTKIKYVSECNAYMLYHILSNTDKPLKELLIIDHGAGLGFFSFLAKKLGLQCICHDISNEYIEGIKVIGKKLKVIPDHFVTGDTDALIQYCNSNQLQADGLASRNVIEHIPDYKLFFKDLSSLSKPGFVSVITTSANIHNPLVKNIHVKIHAQYENTGSNTDMDNPTLNTDNCGIKIRTELIRKHFPKLDDQKILQLAIVNRGFVEHQILHRVSEFIKTGKLPDPFPEPTNTCDPYTGAWVERLVPFGDYKIAAESCSFQFELLPGFYNTHYNSPIKNIVSKVLNLILKIKNPWTVNLSPFLAFRLIKSGGTH